MFPRVGLVLRAALLMFGLALLALVVLASRPAAAQTDPPLSGSWDVNDTTAWNRSVTLMGDLVVGPGGDLSLDNMELVFWCYQKSEFGIKVMGGGRLTANNVVFQAKNSSNPYKFIINTNAVVDLRNCTISDVGSFGPTKDTWGIYVHSTFVTITRCTITRCNVGLLVHGLISPSITYCNISDNHDRGLWCMYSSPEFGNNRLHNNSFGIFLEESPGPVLTNNDLIDNRREALAMDLNSTIVDWTIDRATAWTGSTVFLRGNLTVRSGGALVLQDSTLRLASPPGSRKGLLVVAGGSLRLDNSTVEAAAGPGGGAYSFIAESGSALALEGSAVHGAGYDAGDIRHSGPYVGSDAVINGSDLTGNLVGLVCHESLVQVSNSSLGGSPADLWLGNATARLLDVGFRLANVTFSDARSLLEVGWHLSAGVVWQNGRGVPGANLTVRDGSRRVLFEGKPGPDGWVRWISVLQYRVQDGKTTMFEEVGLLARKAGFADVELGVNMTSRREERLVFNDPAPPTVVIDSPYDGQGTNQTWILVAGAASDDIGLDRVELRLDDSLRWQELPPGNWSLTLTNLSRGDHRIQVRATDLAGQTAYSNVTLTVDTDFPALELEEPFEETVLTDEPGVRIRGRTDPDATVTINGIQVPVGAGGAFEKVLELPEGVNLVTVVAKDRGGNTVTLSRRITVDLTPPPITVISPANNTRTRRDEVYLVGIVEPGARFRVDGSTAELRPDGSFNVTVLLSGGPKNIELYAEDQAGNPNSIIWTLDRRIEQPAPPNPLQKYGLALALVAVLAVTAVAALAVLVLRRRRRRSSTLPSLQVGHPPPDTRGR